MHVHRKFSYSHVQNMPQPHRQPMKLRNMIIYIKTKVLIKFGTSGMLCEELKVTKCVLHVADCYECMYTYMENS